MHTHGRDEEIAMQPRMTQPAMALPDAFRALLALSKATKDAGVPPQTAYLVHLRASQINGCSYCVEMHARELQETGASEELIWGVAAWRETPYFDDAERAALALTEALTRIADSADPVPDAIWEETTRHYDERALAALLIEISAINVWNRLNVATRQPPAGAKPVEAAA
jgi:AhpD family alkylhydroperoxidase